MRLIDEVRLIVSDEGDTEGVVAMSMANGMMMPLISADPERFEIIEQAGKIIAGLTGKTFKVISLTVRTEVGEIKGE
jgi:hypothetical protein